MKRVKEDVTSVVESLLSRDHTIEKVNRAATTSMKKRGERAILLGEEGGRLERGERDMGER
jgi:hypothetical protein